MNDNNTSIELAGASAPALPDELAAEFSDFSDEHKAILAESVQLGVAAMGATVAWIRSMRKMRGSLLSNCQGHTGWERVCGRVYRIGVNEANAMLRGLDGWEARFFGESGRDPVPPLNLWRSVALVLFQAWQSQGRPAPRCFGCHRFW